MIAGVCHNKLANFFALLIMVFSFCYFAAAASAYQEYLPNTTILLGEFVYDDDFTPTTTPCLISVFSPSGAVVASTTMTAETNGWHYYNLAPTTTEGIWPAVMQCGSTLTGDLIKQDKTFVITSNIVSTSSVASAVWSSGSRSLTTFGSLVSDIWANSARTLTDYSTSSIATAVWSNNTRSLTTFGSLVSDVWANPTRTISSFGALAADIWNNIYAPTRNLTDATLTSGSLATLDNVNSATSSATTAINANTDSAVNNSSSTIGTQITSAVTAINTQVNNATGTIAAAVWANTARTLTDYSSSTIANAVWTNGTRSLTTFGSLITDIWANPTRTISSFGALAADIWNNAYAPTRNITDATLSSGSLATLDNINNSSSTIGTQLTAATSNINSNTISAVNNGTTTLASSINTAINNSSSTIGTQITSAVSTVNSNTNAATTTLAAPLANSALAARLTDVDSILASKVYRAKVHTIIAGSAANAFAVPTISIYDADRNLVVTSANMTNIETGIYEYLYTVPTGAAQGNWETVVSTELESGRIIKSNDYWEVRGSPAQVIINSMSDTVAPVVSANLTITNEGLSGYEYQYEWCVVSSVGNACGGGDDVFHSVAAKYINAGEDWNTTLTADGLTAGSYYFKAVVYFGTESSGASRSFTATTDGSTPPPSSPSGGTGGATGSTSAPAPAPETESSQLVSVTDGKLVLMPNQRGSLNNGIGNDCRVSLDVASNSFTSQLVFDVQSGDSPKAIGKKYFEVIAKDGQDNKINNFTKALGITLTCSSLVAPIDNLGLYYYNEKNSNWSLVPGHVFDIASSSVKFSTRQLNRWAVFNSNNIDGNDSKQRRVADLNSDNKINAIDFSILLSFYKTKPPFLNPYVDMNKDSKVDAVDFSIMLSMWDKK